MPLGLFLARRVFVVIAVTLLSVLLGKSVLLSRKRLQKQLGV